MIRVFFCLGYLLFATSTQAQFADLLRDPDITWVGEYTTDYWMNPENEQEEADEIPNRFELVRFIRSDLEYGLYGRLISTRKYLSQQLMQTGLDPEAKIYKDSLLKVRMSSDEFGQSIISQDTGYSSCNGEVMIFRNEIEYSEIFSIRIRQVFWYNQKNKAFDARILAYAPIVDTRDNEGNWNGTRALCWINGEELPRKGLKNTAFNYIFQTKMLDNALDLEEVKVLKGKLDFRKLFADELNPPTRTLIDTGFKPANSSILYTECFGVDTIITYNYITNEEEVRFEHRSCIDQIDHIQFVQNWYYDELKKQLYSQLAGIAPLQSIRDSEGRLRFFIPLFYQMYRGTKALKP